MSTSKIPSPPPGSYTSPQPAYTPPNSAPPISWKWVGAWIGTWIVLAAIAEIPQTENLAAALAITVAVSASYVYLQSAMTSSLNLG